MADEIPAGIGEEEGPLRNAARLKPGRDFDDESIDGIESARVARRKEMSPCEIVGLGLDMPGFSGRPMIGANPATFGRPLNMNAAGRSIPVILTLVRPSTGTPM